MFPKELGPAIILLFRRKTADNLEKKCYTSAEYTIKF
jgi:hypothetical protein